MDNEALHIRYLIGIAAILCAVIIGYNLFFVQEITESTVVNTDCSSLLNSSQTEETEEYTPKKVQSSSTSSQAKAISSSKKININTATLQELCELPGIGPVMAQKILDYRQQHQKFKTIEEIKDVSGVGEKTFQKFSNLITVEY